MTKAMKRSTEQGETGHSKATARTSDIPSRAGAMAVEGILSYRRAPLRKTRL